VDPAREWTVFVGGTFALMGAALAASAQRRAHDAMLWENERRRLAGADAVPCEGDFERLQVRLNRGVGAAAALGGAGLLAAAALGRAVSWRPSGLGAAALAAALILGGLVGALARAFGRGRGPKFLGSATIGLADDPLGERVARACGWVLRGWWIVYGARLLWTLRA
jgi:hypothetical protein